MRGGAIAAGLILAALAIAMGFVPWRRAVLALAVAAIAVLIASLVIPAIEPDTAFAALWAMLLVTALNTYWPKLIRANAAACVVLALAAGAAAGLVCSSDAAQGRLPVILAAIALYVPARWSVGRGWTIPPRIVTSWLLAVALLVGAIPYLVVHPGYVADHRE